MGRSQTIFLMILFIFWPVEQSAFLEKLELQNAMWIRVKRDILCFSNKYQILSKSLKKCDSETVTRQKGETCSRHCGFIFSCFLFGLFFE